MAVKFLCSLQKAEIVVVKACCLAVLGNNGRKKMFNIKKQVFDLFYWALNFAKVFDKIANLSFKWFVQ